jgi:16S rRNA (guanine966-N2)-methyltransferase
MRIIAGNLRGQQFQSPHGHKTHPMSDKVRGALFNILGDIEGLTFLDAFAGSGALAFEAVSRGAKNVIAIEKDRSAHAIIEKNAAELNLTKNQVHIVKANAGGWSIHNMEKKFDILMLDPPYEDLQLNLLQKLLNRHLKTAGVAVLSLPGSQDAPFFERAKLIESKNYGDAQLAFYRKEA